MEQSALYNENYSHLIEVADRSRTHLRRIADAVLSYSEIAVPLHLYPGDTLLDVGSGLGRPGHYLRHMGINTVNVDINTAAHLTANNVWGAQRGNMQVVADGQVSLPFADGSFAAACSQDFLEHVSPATLDNAFSEMVRVLGGNKMVHRITVTEERGDMYGDATHQTFWSAQQWSDWFSAKGWHTQAPTSRRTYKPGANRFGLSPYCHGYFLLAQKS